DARALHPERGLEGARLRPPDGPRQQRSVLGLGPEGDHIRRGRRAGRIIDKEREGHGEAGGDDKVQRREPRRSEGEKCKAKKVRLTSSSPWPARPLRTSPKAITATSGRTSPRAPPVGA